MTYKDKASYESSPLCNNMTPCPPFGCGKRNALPRCFLRCQLHSDQTHGFLYFHRMGHAVRSPQHMTDSTENATPPKSASSRNSNSLFFLVHFRFDFVLRDTEKSEFLDLVDFESVANSEGTAIRCFLKCHATLIKHTDYFVCTEQDSNTHTHTTKKRKKCE